MNAERWRQVDLVLKKALEQEPCERTLFLDGACRDNPSLRKEVEALIDAYEQAGGFLESPMLGPLITGPSRRSSTSLAGQTLGQYDLKSLLGSGGLLSGYPGVAQRMSTSRPQPAVNPSA